MYKSSGVDHFCQLGFWLNGVCKKRRPYFIVHFISRVSIEYGRMLLSMMMIMCAVHRSQCCMSWCSVYSSAQLCWPKNDYILTAYVALFSRHPNARKPFFEATLHTKGRLPSSLPSFQKTWVSRPSLDALDGQHLTLLHNLVTGLFSAKDWLHLLKLRKKNCFAFIHLFSIKIIFEFIKCQYGNWNIM